MRWLRAVHPLVWLLISLLVVLLPFSGKPIHIDDPLYVWTAEQLQSEPGQVFKFSINWSGTATPMAEAIFNPPGAAYYLTFVARCFGWHEAVLHLAFFLVALTAAAGVFLLARLWCKSPGFATALLVSTPIFLLSATTLMCDLPLLMLWVWALVFWEMGEANRPWCFLLGGLLAGLAIFAKYNGILLLPLFVLTGCFSRRHWIWMLAGIALPLLMLWGYESATAQIHGRGLFALTRELSLAKRALIASENPFHLPYQVITLLTFLGGGVVAAAGCGVISCTRSSRTPLVVAGIVGVVVLAICADRPSLGAAAVVVDGNTRWGLLFQIALWALAGFLILFQVVQALWQQRDRVAILLVAWIGMGVGYAIFLNWMVSGRGLLWIIPALVILAARQLERPEFVALPAWKRWSPVLISGVLALLVTMADMRLAVSARMAARQIAASYPASDHGRLWFQGHWGFQYYMQKAGWSPVDFGRAETGVGDWVATPYNNVKILMLPPEYVAESVEMQFPTCSWLTSLHPDTGGSFHANQLGPLPFYFGPVPPETYQVQRLARPLPALQ